jgi:hypothetical protein
LPRRSRRRPRIWPSRVSDGKRCRHEKKKTPQIGSTFEWLDEAGIREEVTAAAVKAVIARQITEEMKKQRITKARMAGLMQTSRAQVDRLLDPENGSATLETLMRAARRRLELV